MIGRILNSKYKILELIGQGGMANVYKALDINDNKYVAVKVLKAENAENENSRRNFLKEARAVAKLSHPNIVDIYDVGCEDGIYYIVMEYVDGNTLRSYIKLNERLSPEETVQLLIPIADGLSHAHKHGIVHRDIKPHNILMTSGKSPKIADFGIARAISDKSESATEEALGSVHYISPEQARGGYMDEKSDLYSLGIMMYEMLTGFVPYDGDSPVGIALMHVQNNVQSPKEKIKTLPSGVCQIVLNLTRRKSADRYKSADKLNEDLMILANNINASIKPTYSEPDELYGLTDTAVEKKRGIDKQKLNKIIKRAIPIFVFAVVVISLAVGTIKRSYTTVPDLSGKALSEVITELKDLGLDYAISERINDPKIEKDHIIRQSPEAETQIKKGSVVYVVVSNGAKISAIPNIVGKGEADAIAILNAAGFNVKDILYFHNESFSQGKVYEQNPGAFTQAREGSDITLYVSLGKSTVLMPKLTGLTLEEAKQKIEEAGLSVGAISNMPSNSFESGRVMAQTPAAFSQVLSDSVVDIVVSTGSEKTKTVSLKLHDYYNGSASEVLVEVFLSNHAGGEESLVYKATHSVNDTVVFKLSGSGRMLYKVFFDGVLYEDACGEILF